MSSVRNWVARKKPTLEPMRLAAIQAARREYSRRAVPATQSTASSPAIAGHRRALHSSSTVTAKIAAVIQYCSGGFSK